MHKMEKAARLLSGRGIVNLQMEIGTESSAAVINNEHICNGVTHMQIQK